MKFLNTMSSKYMVDFKFIVKRWLHKTEVKVTIVYVGFFPF